MKDGIYNAKIDSATLDNYDYGDLVSWINVSYECGSQGFGGYRLYSEKHKVDRVGFWVTRCMEVAGVSDWSKMQGKYIRVQVKDMLIVGIGHIIEDKWFYKDEL